MLFFLSSLGVAILSLIDIYLVLSGLIAVTNQQVAPVPDTPTKLNKIKQTLVRFPQLMWSNLRKNSSGRSPRNFAVVPAFPAVPALAVPFQRPSAAVREKPRDANESDRKNCGWMSIKYIYIHHGI